jgi:transforming growth factor-beta-induced protein
MYNIYTNILQNVQEKIMKKFTFLSLVIVLSLVLAACAAQATPEPTQAPAMPEETEEPMEEAVEESSAAAAMSIVDIAIQDGRFTTLVTALEAAGLVGTLQGEGPFTVFAPTDDAFAALPEGAIDALIADSEALADVLLYHVISGSVKAADVISFDGQEVATLSGDAVKVMVDGESVMINEAKVIITDIEGSNGVIHVIDAVLLPPAEDMSAAENDMAGDEMEKMDQTIVDIALADEDFSTLVTALEAAGLVEALQGDGPFTVFAPTNEAFEALPEGALEGLLADPEVLTDVLLYHVSEGEAMAADVVELNGQKVETLLGQYLDIAIDGEMVMVDETQVIVADIKASNGVIHVIDSVLLPESRTIVEIAVEDGRFTTLVAALEAAGLVEALQGEGPFTVFAPTDDAFAALPEGTVEGLLADTDALTQVLLYHVVDGKVMAAQVIEFDGQEVETLSGDNILVIIEDETTVKINDAQVIIPDIEASNGVIHVIDAVLVP